MPLTAFNMVRLTLNMLVFMLLLDDYVRTCIIFCKKNGTYVINT